MRSNNHVGLRVKFPLFLSDFNFWLWTRQKHGPAFFYFYPIKIQKFYNYSDATPSRKVTSVVSCLKSPWFNPRTWPSWNIAGLLSLYSEICDGISEMVSKGRDRVFRNIHFRHATCTGPLNVWRFCNDHCLRRCCRLSINPLALEFSLKF